MCLGLPAKVLEIVDEAHQMARVEVRGAPRTISLALLPADERASVGDHVLVHLGFAMSRIDEHEAAEAAAMLEGFGEDFDRVAEQQQSAGRRLQ